MEEVDYKIGIAWRFLFLRGCLRLHVSVICALQRGDVKCDHFEKARRTRTRRDLRVLDNELMCRNIKTLFNFDPPATDEEIRAASLQFVRKLSGFNAPSRANEEAFNLAIEEVAAVARRLIDSLETHAPPKNREEEAARARARAAERFGTAAG
jgi:hypothetical protein